MYNNFRSEKIKYKYSPVILKFIFEIIALCRRDYPATGPRQWFTMLSACNTGSIINYLSCFCFSPSITLARKFTMALLELLFRHSPSLISMSLYWSLLTFIKTERRSKWRRRSFMDNSIINLPVIFIVAQIPNYVLYDISILFVKVRSLVGATW